MDNIDSMPQPRPESVVSSASASDATFKLRWHNYSTNLTNVFDELLNSEAFVDVTLTTDGGQSVKCHKVVLSACSPYFQKLFMDNPCQHPIVILRDVDFCDLKAVVDYMYRGEVNVTKAQLGSILKAADYLKVRGLDEVMSQEVDPQLEHQPRDLRPHKKRKLSFESMDGIGGPKRVIKTRDDLFEQKPKRDFSQSESNTAENLSVDCSTDKIVPARQTPSNGSGKPLDDMSDVKPGILEMIQEEQRAKMLEASQITQNWMRAAAAAAAAATVARPTTPKPTPPPPPPAVINGTGNPPAGPNQGSKSVNSAVVDPNYQFQLQNMWQKCWSQNAAMMQGVRYRERGPMKSWRPETMAEAIWSVLQEGLSLSQAARKHDIPYPTFVLYANRVHNMLGPSVFNGTQSIGNGNMDIRPKGRGRPQRILLGNWPDEHVRQVIRAVVFRDGTIPTYNHANNLPPTPTAPLTPHPGASHPHLPNGPSPLPNYGHSPPRAPPPTPSSNGTRSVTPPPLPPSGAVDPAKFMENSLFAAHFKQLTEHFGKNGGQSQNGFLDNFPFKAMMNEVMHQGLPGQPQKTQNMDFEDADENYNSSREESRRGSLATPPRSQMDKEMPRLIPTQRLAFNGTQNRTSDEEETGSNETLSEDPMNLVETSWDLSSSMLNDNHAGSGSAGASSQQQTTSSPAPVLN